MASPIPSAKVTLSYPLYAADFDPQNSSFLLVGGGGGEGRSGVGNKITLLNTSKKEELSEVVDINLSRDEDSVTTLAFAQSTEQWATAFAGINSSTAEQQKGKNDHLRSFLLEYPPRKRTGNDGVEREQFYKKETKALGKVSYFSPSSAKTKETFQRVLRLSKKRKNNGPRLGAVATGLAPEGEIVLFTADTSRPGKDDIRGRIKLDKGDEAADVDIIGLGGSDEKDESKFRVAFCTDYEVYVIDVDYHQTDNGKEHKSVYGTPPPDAFASVKVRPKFRSVRFLNPNLLILLQNKPNGAGSELLLMETSGAITLRKRLHRKIKSATGLSVAHLDVATPSELDQHAIAVAGADTSITILTVDRFLSHPKGRVKFRPHSFLPAVHPTSITSITFSTFTTPTTDWKDTPPQYLKLASTSIANTCVVHTLPLTPYPTPPKPNTPARYLLSPPKRSNIATNTFSVLVALIAIAIGAFFLQAFTEIRGGTPEYLGAKDWLSDRVHGWIARPYMFEDGIPTAAVHSSISKASDKARASLSATSQILETPLSAASSAAARAQQKLGLRDLLARRDDIGSDTSDSGNDDTALPEIIVRHSPSPSSSEEDSEPQPQLSAGFADPEELAKGKQKAKRWEDLDEHEKVKWKRRLVKAGEWTVDEGEAVLKGIFFSGLANAVGAAVE